MPILVVPVTNTLRVHFVYILKVNIYQSIKFQFGLLYRRLCTMSYTFKPQYTSNCYYLHTILSLGLGFIISILYCISNKHRQTKSYKARVIYFPLKLKLLISMEHSLAGFNALGHDLTIISFNSIIIIY